MAEENLPRSVPQTAAPATAGAPPVGDDVAPRRSYTVPKKRNRTLILAVVIALVLVAGFFLWRYLRTYESTDDAQVDVHLYPVSARVAGYVIKVNVDDNQWVQQGTVLVEIDPKDYEVAVAQAQANLANAEATAQSLNITVPITSTNTASQLRSTASGIDNSQAGIVAAQRQRNRRVHVAASVTASVILAATASIAVHLADRATQAKATSVAATHVFAATDCDGALVFAGITCTRSRDISCCHSAG